MDDEKLNIGFVTIASNPYFDMNYSKEIADRSVSALNNLDANIIVSPPVMITDESAMQTLTSQAEIKGRETADMFRRNAVDLVILQSGCFNLDSVALAVVQDIDVPIIIWAFPDEVSSGTLRSNSLAGAISNNSALGKMGKDTHFVLGMPGDIGAMEPIRRIARQVSTLKKLRMTKLGAIGGNDTGYYVAAYNEMLLRATLGVEIIHFELLEFLSEYDKTDMEETRQAAEKMTEDKICNVEENDLIKSAALYLTLKRFSEERGLDAITIRCWPELKDERELNPCFAISYLADEGFVVGCESDVNGAVTMLLHHYLTGHPSFFADLIRVNEKRNTALMWHCGSAACSLARNTHQVCLEKHSLGGSTTVDFVLKPGRVTVSRLGEKDGKYRMFVTTGDAVDTDVALRGNCQEIMFDRSVREVMNTIFSQHIEHHFCIGYGDIYEDILGVCRLANIPVITV